MHLSQRRSHEQDARWPYGSLFFFGVLGLGGAAERQLGRRMTAIWIVAFLAATAMNVASGPARQIIGLTFPLCAAAIFWAYRDYLAVLDEMGREILLTSLAAAYGFSMILLIAALSFEQVRAGSTPLSVPPIAWPLLAEPLRGAALLWIVRRYR